MNIDVDSPFPKGGQSRYGLYSFEVPVPPQTTIISSAKTCPGIAIFGITMTQSSGAQEYLKLDNGCPILKLARITIVSSGAKMC
jgi:hypothetical protein